MDNSDTRYAVKRMENDNRLQYLVCAFFLTGYLSAADLISWKPHGMLWLCYDSLRSRRHPSAETFCPQLARKA